MAGYFIDQDTCSSVLTILSSCMHRNNGISICDHKSAITIVLSNVNLM